MKRSLLIILCFTTILAIWGNDLPAKPSLKKKNLTREEQLSSYTYSLADTLTYVLSDKYHAEYTYQNNLLESVLVEELFDTEWLAIENYLYQYEEDRITEEIYQIYDNGWENYQRESYTYNADSLMTSYQQDNWTDNNWEAYLHIDYSYDSAGLLLSEDWTYYSSRTIDEEYSAVYEYNSENSIIAELWTYSTDSVNWENYLNIIYERNSNNSISHENWKYWYETVWISYLQYTHTYNSFDDIEYTEGLYLVNNQWQYYDNYSYSYNENQNTEELLAKVWSSELNIWVNSYKYVYTYQEAVPNNNNDIISTPFNVTVYPNPFNNQAKYDSKQKINKLSVYNLKGQKISSSFLNSKSGTLPNLNEYPNGIYFFKFEDDKGNVAVSKQVKLK
jgi:hypothetical protein